MAHFAIRQRLSGCIVRGLEALAIENCIIDWRDSTLILVVLYHSAIKISADPAVLVNSVAPLATNNTKKHLFESFLARRPEDKDLKKFGLKEGQTANGEFKYVGLAQRRGLGGLP